jgi:hypothetical protein
MSNCISNIVDDFDVPSRLVCHNEKSKKESNLGPVVDFQDFITGKGLEFFATFSINP